MIVNPLTAIAMFDIVRDEDEKAFVMTAGASQLSQADHRSSPRSRDFARSSSSGATTRSRRSRRPAPRMCSTRRRRTSATALREVIKAEQPRIFLDAVTGPLASAIFAAMPSGARWIIYGRLDPSPTLIPEPGQLIFMPASASKVSGWPSGCAGRQERRAAAVMRSAEALLRRPLVDRRHRVVPLAQAMARVPQELAKPNGKVFIAP